MLFHEPCFLQELSGLKQQLQTANEQVKQLRQDVEALNQTSTDLQAGLTQAEQTHDALGQQLEVKLAAHMLNSSADTAVLQSLSHSLSRITQGSMLCIRDQQWVQSCCKPTQPEQDRRFACIIACKSLTACFGVFQSGISSGPDWALVQIPVRNLTRPHVIQQHPNLAP